MAHGEKNIQTKSPPYFLCSVSFKFSSLFLKSLTLRNSHYVSAVTLSHKDSSTSLKISQSHFNKLLSCNFFSPLFLAIVNLFYVISLPILFLLPLSCLIFSFFYYALSLTYFYYIKVSSSSSCTLQILLYCIHFLPSSSYP